MLFPDDSTRGPRRRRRADSIAQADRKPPNTLRGRNIQNDSPNRALAGFLRSHNIDMVAVIMLDVEVTVQRLRENDLRQPSFMDLAFVAEFVGRIDSDSGNHTDGHRQSDLLPGCHGRMHPAPTREQ